MTRILLAIAVALTSTLTAAQQLYRWTDQSGRVHVTDTPPPPGAKDVRRPAGGSASSAAEAPAAGTEPFALQVARKNAPVTLYSTQGCDACDEARKLLNERGVPFREISINDEKDAEELKKAVGSYSVPALIVGSHMQKGFEPGSYHRALDAAGYPKTGMLPPRSQTEPQPAAPQAEAPASPGEAPTGPYAPGAPPQRSQKK